MAISCPVPRGSGSAASGPGGVDTLATIHSDDSISRNTAQRLSTQVGCLRMKS